MYQLKAYESLDSTNLEAKRLIEAGEVRKSPVVVMASTQTAGKGTHGRRWTSPPNVGLYMSLALTEETTPALVRPVESEYTLCAGIACVELIRSRWQVPVTIKPINDLMVDGKKLGGILTESLIHPQGHIRALIIGIGINIEPYERELDDTRHQPIALREALPPHVRTDSPLSLSPQQWIPELVERIMFWNQQLWNGKTHWIQRVWTTCQSEDTETQWENVLIPRY